MHKKVLFIMVLLLGVSFAAEVVTFDNNWASKPLFNVDYETPMGIEITFSIHEMVIEETEINGISMKNFGIPGVFLPNDEGAPNLAGTGRYIAIPQGARAQITILGSRTEVYHNVEVAPAFNIPRDNDDSPIRYEKDMKIYSRNAYYPETPVKLSNPMQMRGVDVVILGITPFQYNPVTKEMIVYKDIRVKVDFIGGNGHFGEDRLRSRFWEQILQGHLLNYNSLPKIDFYAPERIQSRDGYEYIIIVPDDPVFEAWADTIKAWRKLQGISCDVFTLTEVGGSSATDIENFLNNAYNTWDPAPVAFLLLSDYPSSGDLYGITSPVWSGTGGSCVSDNIYADVNGDNLPEMDHARITAQDESDLSTMINKFLSYERVPYTASNYYDEPLVACCWQNDRWFQICAETIRGFFINVQARNPARQYHGGNPSAGCAWSTNSNTPVIVAYFGSAGLGYIPDTNPYNASWWNNGTAAGINAAINSGAFIVQHRDHGLETGWADPPYHNSDLNNLTNTMFTFVYSINCLTGIYNWSSECFAEKFHRIDYGALGLNAATEVSYSFVNDTYVWGMYDCMWPEFLPDYPAYDMIGYDNLRPCMSMTSGKYFLEASSWPYNPQHKNITYHLFHHHGDAFITLYSEVPQNLSVSHASSLTAGVTVFNVTANDNSIIALTVNGEIIGVAEGTGGPVAITILPQTPGNTMKITITKANYYRYEADVPITSSTYPYVTLSTDIIDDAAGGNNDGVVNPGETIDYGVYAKNVGTGTAQNVYGILSESDLYVSITVDSSWYGDIPEDDSSLSNPYYTFSVANDCPNSHNIDFTLEFHDINDSVFTSYQSITVYAPILTYVDVSVVNDNNGNGILDPGEDADLILTIENEGGATAENVTSTLMTTSSFIIINDNSGNFGSIDPGNTGTNSSDPYNVSADSTTPTGTVIDYQVEVVSGVYTDTLEFSLVVGKKHYYIWNPDPTSTPGQNMHTILTNLGYSGDYGTSLASDLGLYQAVLVCVGIYSSNYIIDAGSAEALALVDFLENQDGLMYLEGGDVWYYDPQSQGGYDFGPLFGIDAISDGTGDLYTVAGQPGTFTEGMSFSYGGENSYIDHLKSTSTGYVIFRNASNTDSCGVANDPGTYKTVGTSFELGLLTDGSPPSTREALLDSIMDFFGITMGIAEDDKGLAGLPMKTMLNALYPNPFRRMTVIRFSIGQGAESIELKIYDAAGRLVKDFSRLTLDALRPTQIIWDGTDQNDRKVPAGVYFVRFEAGDYKKTEKAILLR